MLNDSITSPSNLLEDLVEEEEHSPTTAALAGTKPKPNLKPVLNDLAAGFGMEESPLREKKVESNVNTKIKTVDPEAKRFTAKEKGKGKADPPLPLTTTARSRATGTVEKENQVKTKGTRTISPVFVSSGSTSNPKGKVAASSIDGKKIIKPAAKPVSSTTSGTTMFGMKLPPGKGGARRVPIDSAEAAPVGPGWRG
jgi:hypothetical protein